MRGTTFTGNLKTAMNQRENRSFKETPAKPAFWGQKIVFEGKWVSKRSPLPHEAWLSKHRPGTLTRNRGYLARSVDLGNPAM